MWGFSLFICLNLSFDLCWPKVIFLSSYASFKRHECFIHLLMLTCVSLIHVDPRECFFSWCALIFCFLNVSCLNLCFIDVSVDRLSGLLLCFRVSLNDLCLHWAMLCFIPCYVRALKLIFCMVGMRHFECLFTDKLMEWYICRSGEASVVDDINGGVRRCSKPCCHLGVLLLLLVIFVALTSTLWMALWIIRMVFKGAAAG